jgi:hypothetical protein
VTILGAAVSTFGMSVTAGRAVRIVPSTMKSAKVVAVLHRWPTLPVVPFHHSERHGDAPPLLGVAHDISRAFSRSAGTIITR